MIKVLPLLIIPPLFLILFLNVENLTVKLNSKLKINQISEINENESFQNKKDEEITISDENFSNENNKSQLDDSSKDSEIVLLKSNESKSKMDLNDIKNNQTNNKIPEIKSKPIQKVRESSIKIQFGAFSKLKNAEAQKLKIYKLMSKKFPDFEKKFRILEENNLFKLIYTAENSSSSEQICNFSKSIKINCLILKR
tara:strand:+ start:500 stop:1090 length:591 start_codon:yes stop_codon:yes gene_type:complete